MTALDATRCWKSPRAEAPSVQCLNKPVSEAGLCREHLEEMQRLDEEDNG